MLELAHGRSQELLLAKNPPVQGRDDLGDAIVARIEDEALQLLIRFRKIRRPTPQKGSYIVEILTCQARPESVRPLQILGNAMQ